MYTPTNISRTVPSLLVSLCLAFSLLACTKKKVYYHPKSSTTAIHATPYKVRHHTTVDKSQVRETLHDFYTDWQGAPYKNGGMSQSGIDCSAFTYLAYRNLFTIDLPRTVSEQARQGKKIPRNALKPGDLVFFKTGLFQKHVGIYMEDLSFIHVSTIKGVMISRLDDDYWRNKYWKSKRLL
ncbi:C40 family peptidase [Desulfopila sp. IMCC35008]|uniref:C40 family peptidase n=1 Tax=Desulfopila sp. IMCC35008 TaxID=2653858 RepID=UPI0013CF73B1|nr:NlpC/P60 family protein [Desulfopila sp. IMCC35008]